jgi:hypothetical protein
MWRNGGIAPPFETSALDGGEWLASHSGHFTSRERIPSIHLIEGSVGPTTGMEAKEKRKILPLPGYTPLLTADVELRDLKHQRSRDYWQNRSNKGD